LSNLHYKPNIIALRGHTGFRLGILEIVRGLTDGDELLKLKKRKKGYII
jgi:hypothetical protein